MNRSRAETSGKTPIKTIAILAVAAALLFLPAARAQTTTLTGSFTGTTLDAGWQVGGSGYTPQLTANGLGDSAGSGWLQLTSSAGN